MIKNIERKKLEIIDIINYKIHEIDEKYRKGESLDKYKTVLNNRKKEKSVRAYLSNDKYISDIYQTLKAWDMNKRAAKLKEPSEIKKSFIENMDYFIQIEKIGEDILEINIENIIPIIKELYKKLRIMESSSRLVSFSKTLHFIFPKLFMPIDRRNALQYFYNDQANESFKKYLDIFSFGYDIAHENLDWDKIVGKKEWNTTIPKILDNAVILRMMDK
jgi:hypothetical protein